MIERYEFIDSCRTRDAKYAYPVKKMCAWLTVSTSGSFDWLRRLPSSSARRRERPTDAVFRVFDDSDGTYG